MTTADPRHELRPYFHGAYVDAAPDGAVFEQHSPVDGRRLFCTPGTSPAQVDQAVRAARAAFDSGVWSDAPLRTRRDTLLAFARLIEQHGPTLARLDTLNMGKAIGDSAGRDIPNAAACFRWFAEALDKSCGLALPPQPGMTAMVRREALGVVACISPWNYPMENIAWKLAPALAAGNAVLLKPAELATLSACYLGQLACEAGFPPGILNILPGTGASTGQALAVHPEVDGIFFTGSSATGKKILEYAAHSSLKRVALECGGKSAFVVLSSCRQLPQAARVLAERIFSNQGQTCSAPSRLIVEASVHDAFLDCLLPLLRDWQPGPPLDPATRVGAIAGQRQLDRVLHYVQVGQQQGARLLAGGSPARVVPGGTYMQPTVFDGVDNDMVIAQEEIFGPVLSVITARDAGHAVQLANRSHYGLAASVWTDDLRTAHRMAHQLRAGTVYINTHDAGDLTAPFGGIKDSGNGSKDKSVLALEHYSALKTLWINLEGP